MHSNSAHARKYPTVMLNRLRNVWRQGGSIFSEDGFTFDRPVVVLQSDDWGRVGVRDREAWEQLRQSGVNLGERSYDFYSLETAEDIEAIVALLLRHRDSMGRPACLGMNFILANVDFEKVRAGNSREIYLRALSDGLPEGWQRPGLFEAYREGMVAGVLSPALHGLTHFCRAAVQRYLNDSTEPGILLRKFWSADVPYIHWRMPWVGFEYWDSAKNGEDSFLSLESQDELIHAAIECFSKLFSQSPRSACAPGYRANRATQKTWAAHGIRVAQNGPGRPTKPHLDGNGILHVYRSLDFEPASDENLTLDSCMRRAENCFARGLPFVVSVHSINFHSTLKDFRSRTLALLDLFLAALETKYSDLLYLRDEELYELVQSGSLESEQSVMRVRAIKQKFAANALAIRRRA
jgi:hypothetical protein